MALRIAGDEALEVIVDKFTPRDALIGVRPGPMPQDSRARNHEKRRRAKKNALFTQKRAAENAEADKPRAPAKKAT